MKQKFYTLKIVLLIAAAIFSKAANGQISGTVFLDMNSNGIQDVTDPTEPGEYGVTIKAYNASNALIATATTDAAGNYSFSAAQVAPGVAVRLQFSATAGDYPSKRASADRSNVQFATGGPSTVNIDYAIATKKLL